MRGRRPVEVSCLSYPGNDVSGWVSAWLGMSALCARDGSCLGVRMGFGLSGCLDELESLILAQNERWRHA
jgi:hypothetical protein